ncbi:MAG: acetyl-CoA carboxylase biotin carboxyl carrier protein [Candidatus Omnitrophica bacterium]|nr:acetyl-CoA carboxylase biotin carboxyl carrier protein [Candidatus Omnitrophota bacterium]
MYIKEIKDMLALMNDNGLTELEVEKDGMRIKLKKSSGGSFEKAIEFVPQASAPQSTQEAKAAKEAEKAKNTVDIKAPMVGTFYRSPSPEAAAHVNVGDTIGIGQVLCIIEAMKLMNEIKSEVRGKILEILVDNAEPVEFGQVIFVIEPIK